MILRMWSVLLIKFNVITAKGRSVRLLKFSLLLLIIVSLAFLMSGLSLSRIMSSISWTILY